MNRSILLSWIAVNNDPFEWDRTADAYRLVDNQRVPGPTLTLLFDRASPYCGAVSEAIFFHRQVARDSRESRALRDTIAEIRNRSPEINIRTIPWKGDNPTDHEAIYRFLKRQLPEIRDDYAGRELVVHVSPGTPAMHTIWVLMAETGMIGEPVSLVQSYRSGDRRGSVAVVPISLGVDTLFKAYRRPFETEQPVDDEESLFWDPRKFKSPKLKQVFDEARRFARLRVPLLIMGERGTGKTTLAAWIRTNSPFRKADNDANWPVVPCGQYNPETMRAELFGYKKGAFTGAVTDRPGLLDRLDQDTLFLDEIGDISKPLQRLLIRAVEEHLFTPLGSSETRSVRFRLITATNRKISELRERLDADFFDRISLLRVEMPPLRDIPDDIPWLWEQVVKTAVRRADCVVDGKKLAAAARRALPAIRKHALPGNLRDLFVVAFRILAALDDDAGAFASDDAAQYALAGMETVYVGDETDALDLMRCYVEGMPLDGWIAANGRIDTKTAITGFQRYLATEIRRYAGAKKIKPDAICDIAERTLRKWAEQRGDADSKRVVSP